MGIKAVFWGMCQDGCLRSVDNAIHPTVAYVTIKNIRIYEDERDRQLARLKQILGIEYKFVEPEWASIWKKVQNDGDRGDRLGEIIYGSYLKCLIDSIASKDESVRKAIVAKTTARKITWSFGKVEYYHDVTLETESLNIVVGENAFWTNVNSVGAEIEKI